MAMADSPAEVTHQYWISVLVRARSRYEREYMIHHDGSGADRLLGGVATMLISWALPPRYPKNGMSRWVSKKMLSDRNVNEAAHYLRQQPAVWAKVEPLLFELTQVVRALGYA